MELAHLCRQMGQQMGWSQTMQLPQTRRRVPSRLAMPHLPVVLFLLLFPAAGVSC